MTVLRGWNSLDSDCAIVKDCNDEVMDVLSFDRDWVMVNEDVIDLRDATNLEVVDVTEK